MAEANLQPKEVNDVAIINVGIGLWVVAFIIFAFTAGPGKLLATSFCGILLGLWGRRYTVRRRARINQK